MQIRSSTPNLHGIVICFKCQKRAQCRSRRKSVYSPFEASRRVFLLRYPMVYGLVDLFEFALNQFNVFPGTGYGDC